MNIKHRSMKVIVLVSLAACALAVAARASGIIVAESAADETSIRENVRQLEEGWNRKSGALFARPFAEDADYVVINGLHINGRAAIDKGHQRIFDTVYKESVLRLTVERVRFLRPDVAIVHAAAHLKVGQGAAARDARITLVMSKEKEGWKIVAFQNTQVAEN